MQKETKKIEKKRVAFLFLSFLLTLFLISLTIGGFFFFRNPSKQNQKEKITKEEEAEETIKPLSPYLVLRETPRGKIIENTKEGISLKVPEGWIFQVPTSEEEPIMLWDSTYSKCKIEKGIENLKLSLDDLKKRLSQPEDPILAQSETFREVKGITLSNNQKAIQYDVITEQFGFTRTVELPFKEKIHWTTIYILPEGDKNFCLTIFEDYINSFKSF